MQRGVDQNPCARSVQTCWKTTTNIWPLCLPTKVSPVLLFYGSNTYFMWKYDNKYIKFVRCCYSGFFCDILSLSDKMYLWIKWYTVPFFVSGQTYKIYIYITISVTSIVTKHILTSFGKTVLKFSEVMIYYSINTILLLSLLYQASFSTFQSSSLDLSCLIYFSVQVMPYCLYNIQVWNRWRPVHDSVFYQLFLSPNMISLH